jgi:hypothetical protein
MAHRPGLGDVVCGTLGDQQIMEWVPDWPPFLAKHFGHKNRMPSASLSVSTLRK